MYTLNISWAAKKMYVNETRDCSFEIFWKQTRFSKENYYYSIKRLKKKDLFLLENKLIEKVSDPRYAKKLSVLFKKENNKISTTIRNNHLSTKSFWKPKHCWYKISYYRTYENIQKLHINYPRLQHKMKSKFY